MLNFQAHSGNDSSFNNSQNEENGDFQVKTPRNDFNQNRNSGGVSIFSAL